MSEEESLGPMGLNAFKLAMLIVIRRIEGKPSTA